MSGYSRRSVRPERHRTEGLQQLLVELAAHLFHERKRLGVRERQPVGALLHQRGVDSDERGQANKAAYLIAAQASGISGAVKQFVMVEHAVQHLRRKAALG